MYGMGSPHQPCSCDILPVSAVGFLYPQALYLKWSQFFHVGEWAEHPKRNKPNNASKINFFILLLPFFKCYFQNASALSQMNRFLLLHLCQFL